VIVRQPYHMGMMIHRCWITISWFVLAAAANGQDGRTFTPSSPPFLYGHSFADSFPEETYLSAGLVREFGNQSSVVSEFPPAAVCQPCESVCQTCCRSPCDETGRRFALEMGTVFLFRSRSDSTVLFGNPTAMAENINAADFRFGVSAGIDAGLIVYEQHDLTDVEFRAMWVDEWVGGTTQVFSGSSVRFELNPPIGTSGPRDGFAVYGSEFFSSEVNVRFRSPKKCDGATFVLGFRMMNVDEVLDAKFVDPANVLPDELIGTSTSNRLLGLQLGADRVWRTGSNWCMKLTSRVGVYGNRSEQSTQLISLATAPVTFPAGGAGGEIAWHAEIGVSGKLRLSSCANLIASYRVMYLDGLALASDQLAATSFLSGYGFARDGAIFLNGATVGLELVY
jgi:hypothetical protein